MDGGISSVEQFYSVPFVLCLWFLESLRSPSAIPLFTAMAQKTSNDILAWNRNFKQS